MTAFFVCLLTRFLQWLPRDGIATPAQIVNAVQEGEMLRVDFTYKEVNWPIRI